MKFDLRLIDWRFHFGFRPALSRLDENGPQQTFLAHLSDTSFLKLLKLQIEVRLPHQLPFLLYVVLFVVDGLLIELFVVIIIQDLILIVVGHNWLASLPNTYYHFSFIFRRCSMPEFRASETAAA